MALITTVGGADSDSYVTLVEAEATLKKFYPEQYEQWVDIETDEEREVLLRGSAELMGYLPLRGRKVYCDQALHFPRMLRRDPDDAVYDSIPDGIKECQAQIAFNVLFRASLSNAAVEDGAVSGSRVTQVSLGGGLLMVSFSGDNETSGTILDRITRSVNYQSYLSIKKFLSQVRGGIVEDEGYNEPCRELA